MKNKKMWIGGAVALVLIFLWGVRVVHVNQKYPDVERKEYPQGEMVDLGRDVVFYDSMEGYEVRLDQAKIWNYQDLLNEHGIEEVAEQFFAPEKIYLVEITIKNVNNTETGINLGDLYIQSKSVYCDLDYALYYELNHLDTDAVALRENTEMRFLLPYNLRENHFRKNVWNHLEEYPMWLTVTWYPTKKILRLNGYGE